VTDAAALEFCSAAVLEVCSVAAVEFYFAPAATAGRTACHRCP
jgi:hypothetical protein